MLQLETRVEITWFLLLSLKCDKLPSSLAFNFKLRPCSMGTVEDGTTTSTSPWSDSGPTAGRNKVRGARVCSPRLHTVHHVASAGTLCGESRGKHRCTMWWTTWRAPVHYMVDHVAISGTLCGG